MLAFIRTLAVVVGVVLVAGCSSYSATKATHGDSVRNVIAKQQLGVGGPLAEDEPLEATDGRRMENVTRVYQTNVGNPAAVVGTKEITRGGQ